MHSPLRCPPGAMQRERSRRAPTGGSSAPRSESGQDWRSPDNTGRSMQGPSYPGWIIRDIDKASACSARAPMPSPFHELCDRPWQRLRRAIPPPGTHNTGLPVRHRSGSVLLVACELRLFELRKRRLFRRRIILLRARPARPSCVSRSSTISATASADMSDAVLVEPIALSIRLGELQSFKHDLVVVRDQRLLHAGTVALAQSPRLGRAPACAGRSVQLVSVPVDRRA